MRQMRSQRFSDQGEHHRKLLPFAAGKLHYRTFDQRKQAKLLQQIAVISGFIVQGSKLFTYFSDLDGCLISGRL